MAHRDQVVSPKEVAAHVVRQILREQPLDVVPNVTFLREILLLHEVSDPLGQPHAATLGARGIGVHYAAFRLEVAPAGGLISGWDTV